MVYRPILSCRLLLVGKLSAAFMAAIIILIVLRESGKNPTSIAAASGTHNQGTASQESVNLIGQKLVSNSKLAQIPYSIKFKILESPGFTNPFVFPNGQVFITRGLLDRLDQEGELAAVLSHELGHVWMGNQVGSIVPLKNKIGNTREDELKILQVSRESELKADFLGMCFLAKSGYDPLDMVKMVKVLKEARVGQEWVPEAQSTHPDLDNRIQRIQENMSKLDSCP